MPTINPNQNHKRAFTLVELLIVIAILGLLSSFTAVSLIGHQRKARDAQRKNDLTIFKKAIESARGDCRNSAYYPRIAATSGNTAAFEIARFGEETAYLANSNLSYLKSSPLDPKSGTLPYGYRFTQGPTIASNCPSTASPPVSNSTNGMEYYVARVKLENTKDPDSTISYNSCTSAISLINANGGTYGFDTTAAPASGDGFFYVCGS